MLRVGVVLAGLAVREPGIGSGRAGIAENNGSLKRPGLGALSSGNFLVSGTLLTGTLLTKAGCL